MLESPSTNFLIIYNAQRKAFMCESIYIEDCIDTHPNETHPYLFFDRFLGLRLKHGADQNIIDYVRKVFESGSRTIVIDDYIDHQYYQDLKDDE